MNQYIGQNSRLYLQLPQHQMQLTAANLAVATEARPSQEISQAPCPSRIDLVPILKISNCRGSAGVAEAVVECWGSSRPSSTGGCWSRAMFSSCPPCANGEPSATARGAGRGCSGGASAQRRGTAQTVAAPFPSDAASAWPQVGGGKNCGNKTVRIPNEYGGLGLRIR
jgi:hypothetical protein